MEDNFNPNSENNPEEEQSTNGWKLWLQDNLRIIISIVIVVAIAAGIYSYSNRTQPNAGIAEEEQIMDEDMVAIDDLSDETDEENVEEAAAANEESENQKQTEKTETETEKKTEKETTSEQEAITSQETENSFIESAQPGEGLTHLARKALKDYLEKNPNSELSPEHKIYIEDYLRKKVDFQGGVNTGTSVEFSKSLIKEAIGQAQNLNENQIQNLSKYVAQTPSLT